MATIIKVHVKSGIRYRVLIRRKGQPTLRATFMRKADAEEWARREECDMVAGRKIKGYGDRKRTVADLIDRYVDAELPGPKEAPQRKTQLLWWRERIGNIRLPDLTAQIIAEYRDTLTATPIQFKKSSRPRSNANVRQYLSSLSHLFNTAKREWKWADHNPVADVRKPKPSRGRVRFLSEPEFRGLVVNCLQSEYKPLYNAVVIAIYTGMRYGEQMRLTCADVDLAHKVIRLEETKNDERRTVPLVDEALAVIKLMAKVKHKPSDLLFPGAHKPEQPADVRKFFEIARDAAEIKNLRWHDLRHTCASYAVMSGASLVEVAELLGHKDLQTTRRYSHLSQKHTRSVVERMAEKFGVPREDDPEAQHGE